MASSPTPSALEKIKAESNYLRGQIAAELDNAAEAFSGDTGQLLKHHGMYQQDDRDVRSSKSADGRKSAKAYSLMVRVKVPGGKLSAEQLLAQLELCDTLGNATARITDRQDLQLHGVLKRNVRQAVAQINAVQLTTLGACGDVERNVMCCPAPIRTDSIRDQMQQLAERLSAHFLPRSRAYHEIWLADPATGQREQLAPEPQPIEPLYGATYLPRKFKTAMALADDNCVDVFTNDLGLVAVAAGGQIQGYNLLVGGGMGVTPSNKNTFPALAQTLAFVEPGDVLAVATAIVGVFRDFGDRTDRKRARIKYLIADWGLARFRAKVEEYLGRTLAAPHPQPVTEYHDHLGWHAQGDGRWFYGLNVENGRILDRPGWTLKAALREICVALRPGIRLTPQQNVLFTDLTDPGRAELEAILRRHGVAFSAEVSKARANAMACVALPTCPLAVTESERVLPGLIDQLEAELARLGLENEDFTTRMTGCPNGCSRPYNADVGLVGKTAGKYTLYLGGRRLGDRLAYVYKDLVPLAEIVPTLVPVLAAFKHGRRDGETLGDFCHRLGRAGLEAASQEGV
jgi:sulfite reductase (ferredoxin)